MIIGFASSDLFKKPTKTMISSFLEHNPGQHVFHLVYLDTSEETRNEFKSLIEENGSIFVEHKLNCSLFDGFKYFSRFGYTTYFRIVFPFLVGDIDRLLWIDSDTVVNGDLSFLFEMKLDKSVYGVNYPEEKCIEKLNLNNKGIYINCGVLLYNIDRIKNNYSLDSILQAFVSNQDLYTYADQCFINMFFQDDLGTIPQAYNRIIYRVLRISKKQKQEIIEQGKVVHFVGNIKPWMYLYNNSMYKLYWKYAKPIYGGGFYIRWWLLSRIALVLQPFLNVFKRLRKKNI